MDRPAFVLHEHRKPRHHFDLRLEEDGVLRSWAVPRGLPESSAHDRLAVPVPDHELAAGDFEGVHEGSRRGSGAVIIWDEGTFDLVRSTPTHLSFVLHGTKLEGGFALTETGADRWILVKTTDDDARRGSDIVRESPASVRSGRTWEQVAGRHAD